MYLLKNPSWIESRLLSVCSIEDLPESIFYEINKNLATVLSGDPQVSIVIPVYNEEINIVRTIYSLSKSKTRFGVEIIVVNNNSTDRTQEMLNRMNVRSVFQPVAGCGPARQLGQEHARGKYVLMADGDCFYPPQWIEKMTLALMKPGVSCVYGRYSFLGTESKSRWKFFIYERLRDAMANLRHIKRPCLNALGMSMGYVKELGLQGGFIDKKIRGEDGRMCLYLMQYGKVIQVKSADARVWTLPRTLDKESGLWYSLVARVIVEFSRIKDYFFKQDPNESKKTTSYNPKVLTHFKKFKEVHKEEKVA